MIFFLFFFALVSSSLASGTNVNSVVAFLSRYQGQAGGFGDQRPENIQDTADVLFLASLFGSRADLDTSRTVQYIGSLHNQDYGYGIQSGAPSDLESLRNALFSLKNLGVGADIFSPGYVADTTTFIQTLFDSNRGLFAYTKGSAGDLRATSLAYECFALLEVLGQPDVAARSASIKQVLTGLKKTEGTQTFFSSLTSDNYYAIFIAKQVGFQFDNIPSWAQFFQSRQSENGGFFIDAEHSEVTLYDTTYSVMGLYLLDKELPNTVNLQNLVTFINNMPGRIRAAALAYQALIFTRSLSGYVFRSEINFSQKKQLSFQSPDIIVQGNVLRPLFHLRTGFGNPQPAATVKATISFAGAETPLTLEWDSERQYYHAGAETFDTKGLFGPLSISATATWTVPELAVYGFEEGQIVVSQSLTRPISLWTNVEASATVGGKAVPVGGNVAFGAQFSFDVTIGTASETPEAPLKTGDFEVGLSVLDSADNVIYKKAIDARTPKDFQFEYTLPSSNIPSGQLTFLFTAGTHTSHKIFYNVPTTMLATQIEFIEKKEKYNINDLVEVSMSPAGQLADKTVQHYTSLGNAAFFLDVTSPDGSAALFSVPGVCTVQKHLTCVFKFKVEPNFDALGLKNVYFHYKTVNGKSIQLENYDSSSGELYEEGAKIAYFVDTTLQIVGDANKPNKGQLDYGNNIKFSFQVQDQISKQNIWEARGRPSVYLALRHDKGTPKAFTSSLQPVTQVYGPDGKPTTYQVDWTVNPNAVKGPSSLELVAIVSYGAEIPLLSGGSVWAVEVDVGGKISVDKKTFTSIGEFDTQFFVEFELTCQKQQLQGASLLAKVFAPTKGGLKEIASEPVVAGAAGTYQISWHLPTKGVPSGQYEVQVYREVDLKRLEGEAKPYLEVVLSHVPPMQSPLPFKTEVLVTFVLGLAFLVASFKKMEIEKK